MFINFENGKLLPEDMVCSEEQVMAAWFVRFGATANYRGQELGRRIKDDPPVWEEKG